MRTPCFETQCILSIEFVHCRVPVTEVARAALVFLPPSMSYFAIRRLRKFVGSFVNVFVR